MYAAFSNWVQSHRDLPLKLNQQLSRTGDVELDSTDRTTR